MGKIVTTLVVFFIAMNAFGGIMVNQGIAADLGLDATVSQECPYDNILETTEKQRAPYPDCQAEYSTAKDLETGTGTGSTLFGMYNTLADGLSGVYENLFGGLVLLERAGMPGFLTKGLLAPVFSVLVLFQVASFVRGYNL